VRKHRITKAIHEKIYIGPIVFWVVVYVTNARDVKEAFAHLRSPTTHIRVQVDEKYVRTCPRAAGVLWINGRKFQVPETYRCL
jgi:hypothetical protein